ncbi:fumarylacetoacetate hydrolase family protein [Oceanobacillus halophilus]|uniref:FAA hydrolase family protein n=1 Tax=Oceanobacillus halophilus TaxID=930130 RepID=A0A495A723_9BACI|nr:fumarylacetoacetate hydrolase family protein [Oceanobacillus halophilus]RKQ35543.1 FAA hydrolase family protein [Oceanobacillus halophilus]
MKLVSYRLKGNLGSYRIGFLHNDKIVDVQHAYQRYLFANGKRDLANDVERLLPSNPNTYFSLGSLLFEKASSAYGYALDSELAGYQRNEVLIGTPISNPGKIICVGKNYADHAAEMESDIPDFPVLFAKFDNAIIGPEDNIVKSGSTSKLDYEVELGIVIGKETSKVSRENAYDYIAGYTIGNDISARDLQRRTQQWLQGKTLDKSTPIGPYVVTKDEVENPANLSVRSFVNGEERQSSNTSLLIFDIPFLIEYISKTITLKPGDIILTGTPNGVGVAMNPPQFLKDGDVVTVEIDGVGRMENKVVKK